MANSNLQLNIEDLVVIEKSAVNNSAYSVGDFSHYLYLHKQDSVKYSRP